MRFPPFPTLVQNLCLLSHATARLTPSARLSASHTIRPALLRTSMPSGAGLFSSLVSSIFSASGMEKGVPDPLNKGDQYWEAKLTRSQLNVLRRQGTERPFSGEYNSHYPDKGVYNCAACEAPLFTAQQKFRSGCGWPAFFDNIPGAVTRRDDVSLGMTRTEINCANCGSHLGHVFKGEGLPVPTDERHCVNSISLKFNPKEAAAAAAKAGEQSKV